MNVSVSLVKICKIFDYFVPPEIENKIAIGVKVKVPFGKTTQFGFVFALNTNPNLSPKIKLKSILEIAEELPYKQEVLPLAKFLTDTYANTFGESLNALKPTILTAKSLTKKTTQIASLPLFYQTENNIKIKESLTYLSNRQKAVFCGNFFMAEEASLFYAHQVLSEGGQVLILVPDIVSCAKLIEDTKQRLGTQNIFLWHSKVLVSERKRAIADIFSGRPCVIIGTRSACLLPFKNLRLSIMFFEEDKLFKQEEMRPYYHTREVILKRAELEGGKVLLVSPSPSFEALKLESTFDFEETKTAKQVAVIPTEFYAKNKFISPTLELLIEDVLDKNKQALLLLNRLGFARAYSCLFCGQTAKCKKCGAVLSHEQTSKGDFLLCKKCGAKESIDQICPHCQNQIFRDLGAGTQAVELEVKKLFPNAKVLRLDSLTLPKLNLKKIDFSYYDIILGTNLAIRANFQNCRFTLASILEASQNLNMADFRSSEHFAQIIYTLKTLLSKEENSKLIVQIKNKELFDFNLLEKESYLRFSKEELAFRKEFYYPPYTKLVQLILTAKNQKVLDENGSAWANMLKTTYSNFMEIEGPVSCGIKSNKFVKNYYLIKVKNDTLLANFLSTLRQSTPPRKLELKIVADPYNFF